MRREGDGIELGPQPGLGSTRSKTCAAPAYQSGCRLTAIRSRSRGRSTSPPIESCKRQALGPQAASSSRLGSRSTATGREHPRPRRRRPVDSPIPRGRVLSEALGEPLGQVSPGRPTPRRAIGDPHLLVTATADVMIVGAGPTGLALAAQLKQFRLRPRIVDRQLDRARESRALVMQPRTLEVLRGLGIAQTLIERSNDAVQLRLHFRDRARRRRASVGPARRRPGGAVSGAARRPHRLPERRHRPRRRRALPHPLVPWRWT
jgi:hypothetical protein